jgi:hydrogenase expression/formation protein HypD
MPPAMKALVLDGAGIDGFIAPGHVSAITGTAMYEFLPAQFSLGVVVAGFEPADLMQAILMLVRQHEEKTPQVEIQYRRVVNQDGNPKALQVMYEVFETGNDEWRGLGIIPDSGLKIRSAYAAFDAESRFPVTMPVSKEPEGCICGLVLRGLKTPPECSLFARSCTPADPVGTCMVSSEGTCATYYKYRS